MEICAHSLYRNEGVLPCVYEHESYRVEPIIWSLQDVWLYLKIFIACLLITAINIELLYDSILVSFLLISDITYPPGFSEF